LLHNVEIATNYLTTELTHNKLKYGLFSRVISCHDRSAQNNVRLRAVNVHRIHGHKRLDDDASLASLCRSGNWQHCVVDVLGRRPVETQKNLSWDNLRMSGSGL